MLDRLFKAQVAQQPMVAPKPAPVDDEAKAHAGLLVVHGVGAHARTVTVRDFLDPLVGRLAAEGRLVNVAVLTAGDEDQLGGPFDGATLRYIPAAGAPEREVVVLEGRWNDVFVKEGQDRISAWVARNAGAMMVELTRYHMVGRPWPLALVTAGCLVAALLIAGEHPWWALGLVVVALLAAALAVVVWDLPDVRRSARHTRGFWPQVAARMALIPHLIFHLQRGLVIPVTALGVVLLPAAAMVLRLLSSIPLLGRLTGGAFAAIETGFMSGGIADMQAIATNQLTAAAVRTRLRLARRELESRVRPGGTIAVVAHSGGAPPAWRLLSESEIHDDQATTPFRYNLLTVGAALNWAIRGFGSDATPLRDPLVNYRSAGRETRWLNVYGGWDPVPHGPVDWSRLPAPALPVSWDVWPGGDNLPTRNLGAPVPDEHGEYWRNQQEFVPVLMRAVDDQTDWATAATDRANAGRWSNVRLALLSALVRLRIILFAIPAAAIYLAVVKGVDFFDALIGCEEFRASLAQPDRQKGLAESALSAVIGNDKARDLIAFLCEHTTLPNVAIILLLGLLAYALMDVYTNVAWHTLGRRTRPLTPDCAARPWLPVPIWDVLVVWAPTVIALPLVLWAFNNWEWRRLGSPVNLALIGGNALLAVGEVWWLSSCLYGFCANAFSEITNSATGRRRAAGQAGGMKVVQTAAEDAVPAGAT